MVTLYVQRGGADEPRPTVKEVASMRRIMILVAVAALMVAMLVAMAAPAFAVDIPTKAKQKYCENAFFHGAQGGPPGVGNCI